MRVGIVGTGMLGGAVALRLLGRGHEVSVYNRTPSKTAGAASRGARAAATPAEAADADAVIVAVRDAAAVREVSFGPGGIASGARAGAVVADMSTISPSESRGITAEFAGAGITRIDAPVMGGPDAAASGSLVLMASGDRGAYERCMPALGDVASRSFHLGGPGDACSVKLAMNLQITMIALGLAEGITLVRESGMDPARFLEVLNSTYFATGTSRGKAHRMIGGGQEPTFTLANLGKDIATMLRAAGDAGADLPMARRAGELYAEAAEAGLGGADYTGIIGRYSRA